MLQITHLDGGTTEVVDVVKPEPLADKEDQESLHDRLWDQVAANLTTLGEMNGVRYQVSPVEELEEKSKKSKKDYDGDGEVESLVQRSIVVSSIIRYNRRWVRQMVRIQSSVKESFNVKSPVTFSKPEEKVEESISEDGNRKIRKFNF